MTKVTPIATVLANPLAEAEAVDARAQLDHKEAVRKKNYDEYWNLYKGDHWDASELDEESPSPVFNKVFTFINKAITFLVGNSPTVNYPKPEAEKLLAPYVNVILKNSGGIQKLAWEALQMGSVTGDLFLKVVYDHTIDGVRIQVSDSSDVDVRYPFRDYQNDIPSLAVIEWQFIDETDDNKIRTYREEWTKDIVKVFIDDELDTEKSGVNLLGSCPIVHVRNLQVGKEPYGMSDVEQLQYLNKMLNAQVRRFRDDVEYSGDPVTLLYGVRISQIEKGVGKMWGNLPIKGKVENLTLDTDFPSQQKFIEYINEAIHEVGNIPKDSVTGNKSVSNTSGVALHMNNLPIIELVDRKRISYKSGFERAIKMALLLMVIIERKKEVLNGLKGEDRETELYKEFFISEYKPSGILDACRELQTLYEKDKDYTFRTMDWNEVEFEFADYLPKDELVQMQLIKDELSLGLESRKGAMKRLGKDNIDAILKEVDEDMEALAKLKAAYGAPSKNSTQGMRGEADTSEGAAKELKKTEED